MTLTINVTRSVTLSKDILIGQIFYADGVGSTESGLFIKLESGIYPIRSNGQLGGWGSSYSAPACPVIGYNPIKFEFQDAPK